MASTHLVLARKYRPQKFSEVVEQQTAVRSLQNAIAAGRLGSAYLFFGPRGVGKTTIARILAKRVNCIKPQDGEPCDECESCVSILSGNSLDVIEIDAASNRGIDNIRELREQVKFAPMHARKKVYIIDEVHMLTTESFNALLKTLEEPPSHVLFVLATTEFHKIPETILSRCQVFTFRKVPLKVLKDYLQAMAKREGIEAEDEALFWIARRGDGSVRDSLSFMEQAMAYCDGKLKATQVKELVGSLPLDLFIDLTRSLTEKDVKPEKLLAPVQELFNAGSDLNRFIWEYLDFLRTVLLVKAGSEDTEFLGIPGTDVARILDGLKDSDSVQLQTIFDNIYVLLSQAYNLRLRNSYESRVLIEIAIIEIREKLRRPSLSKVLQRLNHLSAAIHSRVPYSPEEDIQNRFLGTSVDPTTLPPIE